MDRDPEESAEEVAIDLFAGHGRDAGKFAQDGLDNARANGSAEDIAFWEEVVALVQREIDATRDA